MIIDKIENAHYYKDIHPGIAKALDYIQHTDFNTLSFGKHDIEGDNVFIIYKEYNTKPIAGNYLESHQNYMDVQYIVDGIEHMGVATKCGHVPHKAYDVEQDYMLFDTSYDLITVKKGMFAIFFPDDMHMPDITTGESATVRKAVIKVRIQHS